MKDIQTVVEDQRHYFEQGETKDVSFRRQQLLLLRNAIRANETLIMDALKKDLNKSAFEAYGTEIGIVLEEIGYMLRNMERLSRPKWVRTPIVHFPAGSSIHQEPYGVVLILSPWNYPFQLTMAPLVGAMATGNCAVVKPSNYSPNVSAAIHQLLSQIFEARYIDVVEGGREANQALLEQKFDYICFTGSVEVGKVVMAQAAKHLTPVTLELGGKSPCIVDRTADIPLAARRIAWGKFLNAGQTCVAPDYVLVQKSVKQRLIEELAASIRAFYGSEPHRNEEYPRIVNRKHFERLLGLMKSGVIAHGGQSNPETNQIAPTILDDITWDMPVMQEEIFGPLLPILEFDTLEDVVTDANRRPKPLALYFFTGSKADADYVLKHVSFGGGCINDTVVHLGTPHLPFGGVGNSGMGSYHGEASFRTFSHSKSVLSKSNLLDIALRYPPYRNHLALVKKILK